VIVDEEDAQGASGGLGIRRLTAGRLGMVESGRGGEGEADDEGGAVSEAFAFGPEVSVVGFGDAFGDGETESEATEAESDGFIALFKGMEDGGEACGFDSDALVDDVNFDFIAGLEGADGDETSGEGKLGGVSEEVPEDLVEAGRVAFDVVARGVGFDGDAEVFVIVEIGAADLDGAGDEVVDIDAFLAKGELSAGGAGGVEKIIDEADLEFDVADDTGELLLDIAGEVVAAGEVGEDGDGGSEGGSELVTEHGEKLVFAGAVAFEFLGGVEGTGEGFLFLAVGDFELAGAGGNTFFELVVDLAEAGFHFLELGDVAHEPADGSEFAVDIGGGADAEGDPEGGTAIFGGDAGGPFGGAVGLVELEDFAACDVLVLIDEEAEEGASGEEFGAEAEEGGGGAVGLENFAGAIGDEVAVGSAFEEVAVAGAFGVDLFLSGEEIQALIAEFLFGGAEFNSGGFELCDDIFIRQARGIFEILHAPGEGPEVFKEGIIQHSCSFYSHVSRRWSGVKTRLLWRDRIIERKLKCFQYLPQSICCVR
jgi:hypothetical protein